MVRTLHPPQSGELRNIGKRTIVNQSTGQSLVHSVWVAGVHGKVVVKEPVVVVQGQQPVGHPGRPGRGGSRWLLSGSSLLSMAARR